jgi:hypothetical protein
VAFQRLVSTIRKEVERCQSLRLENEAEELMELLDSNDDVDDQFPTRLLLPEWNSGLLAFVRKLLVPCGTVAVDLMNLLFLAYSGLDLLMSYIIMQLKYGPL